MSGSGLVVAAREARAAADAVSGAARQISMRKSGTSEDHAYMRALALASQAATARLLDSLRMEGRS